MSAPTIKSRGRTLLAAKVIFNFGQSAINCVVRRITDDGAIIELESGVGIPDHFQLSIASEAAILPCKRVWQSERQIGASFATQQAAGATAAKQIASEEQGGDRVVRSMMLALRAGT